MRRRFDERVEDDAEFLAAVKVIESRGYRVIEKKEACANRREIMEHMTKAPKDIYTLTKDIYGDCYTEHEKKRLRSLLKKMEMEGYVVKGPDRYTGRNWISTWGLA